MSAKKAVQLLEEGRAVKTGAHRIGMLMDRTGQLEYGYEWKGQQSGYAGPQVMQRVPMMKERADDRRTQETLH